MRIETLEPGIAARVHEVDLASGAVDALWPEIEVFWQDFPALVFPEQSELTVDDQVAFLSRFGPVLEERVPGEKHSFVSNDDGHGTDEMNDGYREGELTAHMDYSYTPYPADAISLLAIDLPQGGSETLFYSNTLPLSRMPEELRAEIADYTIFCAHDLAEMKPDARLYLEERTDPDAPTQSHTWPLVRPHPHKPGLDALMCTLQQTERIIELEDAADGDRRSRALLRRLFEEFLYVPQNEYAHHWEQGDLVVWDNVALQHARRACPRAAGRRTFRRVAVCQAGNAIHETVEFLALADSSVAFS